MGGGGGSLPRRVSVCCVVANFGSGLVRFFSFLFFYDTNGLRNLKPTQKRNETKPTNVCPCACVRVRAQRDQATPFCLRCLVFFFILCVCVFCFDIANRFARLDLIPFFFFTFVLLRLDFRGFLYTHTPPPHPPTQ